MKRQTFPLQAYIYSIKPGWRPSSTLINTPPDAFLLRLFGVFFFYSADTKMSDLAGGTDRIKLLYERARRISILLESYSFSQEVNPFERTVLYLLQNQEVDGGWGSTDYPIWSDIITALALQILEQIGFHVHSTWEVTRSESHTPYIGGISKALDWLANHQKADGDWGEDIFDTCQVLKALHGYREKESLDLSIEKGLMFVKSQIEDNFSSQQEGEWYGPGFYAAAIDLFNTVGEDSLIHTPLEKLYSFQLDTGVFSRSTGKGNYQESDLDVWHTALAILSMHSLGIPSDAHRLSSAVKWLISRQNEDGSWGHALWRHRAIYTGYSIMAISAINGREAEPAQKGVSWLIDHQSSDGRVGGHEGTIMSALALSRIFTYNVAINIPLSVLLDIQDMIRSQNRLIREQAEIISSQQSNISSLSKTIEAQQSEVQELGHKIEAHQQKVEETQQQIEQLTEKNKEWQKKWEDHPLRLSSRFITLSGWILAVVSLLIALLTLWPQIQEISKVFISPVGTPTITP